MKYNLKIGQYWIGYGIMEYFGKRSLKKSRIIIYKIEKLAHNWIDYSWQDNEGCDGSFSSYISLFIEDCLNTGDRKCISQAQGECLWNLWRRQK
jgi:hypothetical protein